MQNWPHSVSRRETGIVRPLFVRDSVTALDWTVKDSLTFPYKERVWPFLRARQRPSLVVFLSCGPLSPVAWGRASLILDGLVKSTSKGPKVKIFSLFFSEAKETLSV